MPLLHRHQKISILKTKMAMFAWLVALALEISDPIWFIIKNTWRSWTTRSSSPWTIRLHSSAKPSTGTTLRKKGDKNKNPVRCITSSNHTLHHPIKVSFVCTWHQSVSLGAFLVHSANYFGCFQRSRWSDYCLTVSLSVF